MPDLLFELFSEEIPARMQARGAEDLRRMVTERLVDAGLVYEAAAAFATPRRLALAVAGFRRASPISRRRRRGRGWGRPRTRCSGFLKSAGLASITEATIQKDPEKGRLLRRADREARTRDDRRARRNSAARHPHLSVAEIDALGRTFGATGRACLGAAAACDRRDFRAGDRGARYRPLRGRRHHGGRDDPRAPVHGARRFSCQALRRLCREAGAGQGRARSGAAPRHHSCRCEASRIRPGLRRWSRTRRCSTKWRASSNGRWC